MCSKSNANDPVFSVFVYGSFLNFINIKNGGVHYLPIRRKFRSPKDNMRISAYPNPCASVHTARKVHDFM